MRPLLLLRMADRADAVAWLADRLGKTLDLNPDNRLVGLGQTLSVLMPLSSGFAGATSGSPQPLVRTAPGSRAVLAFLGIVSWWHLEVYTLVRRLPLDFPSAAGRQHCCSSRLCVFEVSLELTRTRVSALAEPARAVAE